MQNRQRGAALVEYVMLLGLIGVLALSSVSLLGNKVVGVFDLTSETLSSVQYSAEGGTADGGESSNDEVGNVVLTPTFSLKGDGSDVPPFYVTQSASGTYWIVDLDPLLEGIVDRNDAVQMSQLRANVQVSQAGTFEPRATGLNGVAMTVDPRIRWIVPGSTKPIINKIATEEFPESELLAYEEATGRTVPSNATGIRIQRYNSCTPNARCHLGEFFLNIEFYRQQ